MQPKKNRPGGGTPGAEDCDLKRDCVPYKPTAAARQAARCRDRAAPVNAARRQLAARHISEEPRRATYAAVDIMVAELPYGFWKDATGRIVVFNRGYLPIWQRLADGTIERANSGEWVQWVEERWFNADRIRYEKSTRERLREILRKFFAGEDLERFTTKDVRYVARFRAARR